MNDSQLNDRILKLCSASKTWSCNDGERLVVVAWVSHVMAAGLARKVSNEALIKARAAFHEALLQVETALENRHE